MNLVGPRQHPIDVVSRYEVEDYCQLVLNSGMTGLCQGEGRSDVNWAEALEPDLYNAETPSLASDVVLLLQTGGARPQSRGAS